MHSQKKDEKKFHVHLPLFADGPSVMSPMYDAVLCFVRNDFVFCSTDGSNVMKPDISVAAWPW